MKLILEGMKVLPKALTVTYDADADAAYIFWSDKRDPAQTLSPLPWLLVDLDDKDAIVGFEILGAKAKLGLDTAARE